jgi:hypothetical protein
MNISRCHGKSKYQGVARIGDSDRINRMNMIRKAAEGSKLEGERKRRPLSVEVGAPPGTGRGPSVSNVGLL